MVFKESLKKSPEHATFRGFVLCVGVGLFREAFADAKEILGLEGCAADQAAVDVFLGEELRCVRGLARTAVEDGCAAAPNLAASTWRM